MNSYTFLNNYFNACKKQLEIFMTALLEETANDKMLNDYMEENNCSAEEAMENVPFIDDENERWKKEGEKLREMRIHLYGMVSILQKEGYDHPIFAEIEEFISQHDVLVDLDYLGKVPESK